MQIRSFLFSGSSFDGDHSEFSHVSQEFYVVYKKYIFVIQNHKTLKNSKRTNVQLTVLYSGVVNWITLFHSPQEIFLKFKPEFLVESEPPLSDNIPVCCLP